MIVNDACFHFFSIVSSHEALKSFLAPKISSQYVKAISLGGVLIMLCILYMCLNAVSFELFSTCLHLRIVGIDVEKGLEVL